MKSLLLTFALFATFAVSSASAQTVTVNSPTDVQINGQSAGQVADAIHNNPTLASAIQTALATWQAAQQAAQASATTALQAQITTLTSQNASLTSQVQSLQAQIATLQAQLAAAQGH